MKKMTDSLNVEFIATNRYKPLQTVDNHTEQYWIHLKLEKILAYCHCPDTHLQGLQSVST